MLIIPAIDIKGGRCVRLVQGDMARETVFADNPAGQAVKWEAAGARMIHVVDLDGAVEGRPKNWKEIRAVCGAVKCAVQLGGGIRNLDSAKICFDLGISRIVLGTLLIREPDLARKIAEEFPGRVLAGIDVKDNMAAGDGWLGVSEITGPELAAKLDGWPLAGIVFTDVSRDGMMLGANIPAIEEMARSTRHPLVASGGVSSNADLAALSAVPRVEGAIIGKALYTGAMDLSSAIREFQC